MRISRLGLAPLLLAAALTPAQSEEGMWTPDNFPSERVEKLYGFHPDQAWLDKVRLSSLRLAGGCSASFVSPNGLVQTNHHCVQSCIEQLSTSSNDLIARGFDAREAKGEIKCPDIEANQLIDIQDVTGRINEATAGKDGSVLSDALRITQATIAKECYGNDENFRCDVVSFYHGGIYKLYKYRRYQDIRLVFAPEMAIAFFGGDPDNFEFPRYDLDISFLRVYSEGKPLDSKANYLPYAKIDVRPGDLTFTAGHPGSTNRLDTVAELQFRRDVTLPRSLFNQSELRGVLTEFATKGPEQARIVKNKLFGIENSLKAQKGQFAALVDPAIINSRMRREIELRAKISADPEMQQQFGAVFDNIRATMEQYRIRRDRYVLTEDGQGFQSKLLDFAKGLVRNARELQKADEERLKEFTEANLPTFRQSVASTAPIYPELERLTLTFSLTKLRETLGPDDEFVKKVLGPKSPAQLAAELVDGTSLVDVEARKQLLCCGSLVEDSTDPMIAFARMIDSELRAIRKDYEDNVQAPLTKYKSQLAAAMFKIYGMSNYPDATFTHRISYGTVEGYKVNGKQVHPITTIGGAFKRANGADPFKLPDSWVAMQGVLDLEKPFNFASTNDIIGGNSGSPVINRYGEVVGLIFDGNIQSLGGRFGFDAAVNRSVSVNVGAIREVLSKVYQAHRIVNELENG